jgi:hypothetical protein
MLHPRVRQVLILSIVAASAGLVVSGRAPSEVLSRTIRSEDWAVDDWSAIRVGQLSVVHGQHGDELQVNALSVLPRLASAAEDRTAVPACTGNCFVVSEFDYGNENQLGGFFGTCGQAGSTARAALDGWDDGRRALTIDFSNSAAGSSGAWISFFDPRLPRVDRVYLDATPLRVLTFWIRGRTGGEAVVLKAADAVWERKEDALVIGDVGSFLAAGRITTAWQHAVVPLSALSARLDRRALALISFEAMSPGGGRIAIKGLGFCLNPGPGIPLSPPAATSPGRLPSDRALWVWNTTQIIDRAAEQRALVAFARRNQVTQLFLQLPDDPSHRGVAGSVVLDTSRWKSFLGLLSSGGLRAHALVGSPEDALPEEHQRVLTTVEHVLAYNASAAGRERFAGIRYDIEPYLLPGFRGARRQRILAGYLDLLAKTASRARSAGVEFGVDMPFWYDSLDDLTGEQPLIEYAGARKPASEHILDLVDSAAVMAYRTAAYGADSIAALADGELRYAALKGKRVFIGLETTALSDEDLLEFDGEPGRGLPEGAPADRTVIIDPASASATAWVGSRGGWDALRAMLDRGQPGRRGTPLWWPVRRVVAVPATKLTFARLGAERLGDAMRQIQAEFSGRTSFAGFAIHDFVGYQSLLADSGQLW